jgi:STE24 endopeptidase
MTLHSAAALLVVAGVLAEVVRPLAPDLGPPPDPARWFDTGYLALADRYRGPLYAAGLAGIGLRLLVVGLVAWSPPGRRAVTAVLARTGPRRPAVGAAAVAVAMLVAVDVALLPLAFWAGYVHEGAYGFRTQGLGGWWRDWLVAAVPVWLVSGLVVLGGYALARRLPRAWPPLAGLAGAGLVVALSYAGPVVLEPLRFRTEPLAPSPVHTEVERVLARAGERLDEIVVADASRRTTKQNAYVSGLGPTRRVVLYDTFLAGRRVDEVGVVLAHELGHHRNGDLGRSALSAGAGAVTTCYLLAALVRRRARAGRQDGPADPRAAALVVAVVVVLQVASLPLQMLLSRRAEAAADLAALSLSEDPGTFIEMNVGLARANLADPDPPGWAYLLWSSHPITSARLELALRWPFPSR